MGKEGGRSDSRSMSAVPGVRNAEPARIREIDLSKAARTLAVLRATDYFLVVTCGLGAIRQLPAVAGLFRGNWSDALAALVGALIFGLAAYTGWRHVGVIDPRVWRRYLWVFSLLVVLAAVILPSTVWVASHDRTTLNATTTWSAWFAGLPMLVFGILGLVSTLRLRRMSIPHTGMSLKRLLEGLVARSGESARRLPHVSRAHALRGLTYAAIGGGLVLVVNFWPVPASISANERPPAYLRMYPVVLGLGFFLIVRARRYFQVSAESLLAVDKRPPILFLRSFADDEKQKFRNSQRALLDFSLETRLANHFYHFGPFIGIGAPGEKLPLPGAARVQLGDDQWQGRVLGWIEGAYLIVMYCGRSKWVNWELRHVLEAGRATSLIFLIPEIKRRRSARRREEISARVADLRDAFRGTPWSAELSAYDDFEHLRAMLFRADGSVLALKSRSRSRDAYHLAALVAHQQLLEPAAAAAE